MVHQLFVNLAVEDLDGHQWEVFFMDERKFSSE
jgi:predicted lactoylglutathione lyase